MKRTKEIIDLELERNYRRVKAIEKQYLNKISEEQENILDKLKSETVKKIIELKNEKNNIINTINFSEL